MKRLILAAAIILSLVAAGCTNSTRNVSKNTQNTNDSSQSPKIIEPRISIEGWKTYTNKKYGYNIRYPADYKITQFEGMGASEPITPEASYIKISDTKDSKDVFSIRANVIETYSEQAVKNYFTNAAPDKITVTKTTIADKVGYKAEADATSSNYDYYFAQKPGGSVMGIEVLKNNDIGITILSTLSFND